MGFFSRGALCCSRSCLVAVVGGEHPSLPCGLVPGLLPSLDIFTAGLCSSLRLLGAGCLRGAMCVVHEK